ncbi:MAG: M14 family zinc carboxypeptidase [Phycisphaerae bacterium]
MNCAIKKHGLIAPRLLLLRRSMLPVISILFITTFHGARASGPAVATPGNGGTSPAVMSPAQIAAIKVPKGFHLAQLPWRYGHDLYNPASVNVPLAQPWYQPILEEQRHRAQLARAAAQPTAATVQILSNFSDAVPIKVHEISATHYALTFTGPLIWPPATGKLQNWFVFRVRGAKGKTIRFDLTNGNIKWWQTLNPVYSYCKSLSHLRSLKSTAVAHATATQAFDGTVLPDTSGQSWHYIANTWRDGEDLCLVQTFAHNSAYIAMRYPYTVAYNQRFLGSLKANPNCQVVTIGKSQHGRPLQVVEIPRPKAGAGKNKPGILIYAREYGDEIDGSWLAQGAIQFLVSDSPAAQKLRANYEFLVIPILDPDGAAVNDHGNEAESFVPVAAVAREESSVFADFFQKWINTGHRIDIALNEHCLEAGYGRDVSCAAVTGGKPYESTGMAIVRKIDTALAADGYAVDSHRGFHGTIQNRLGHWLNRHYGTVMCAFEIDSQEAERHLSILQLRNIGQIMMIQTANFLVGAAGRQWDAHVQSVLSQRAKDWKKYGAKWHGKPALTSEQAVQWRVHNARLNRLIRKEGLEKVADSGVNGWASPGDPW